MSDDKNRISCVSRYISIDDIQREHLPIGMKQIRALVKENLPVKMPGGMM